MKDVCCFCMNSEQRETIRSKKEFSHRIEAAELDPENINRSQRILSQLDGGNSLEIVEMGDFSLGEALGSGASSDVWSLVRKNDGQKFAGKFIKPGLSSGEFLREAKILKSCSTACANIVHLIAIVVNPKCLVLEFYVNGSLDKALKEDNVNVKRGMKTELPFFQRLGYILDTCKAVDHLHRENICHRDIAMRNILLSDDKKHAILTDFSMSRIVTSSFATQSTFTAGLPKKSAPETFRWTKSRHENTYSLKSDIWSLGILIFEVVSKESLGECKASDMPTSIPHKWLPPTQVFNRMDELRILILQCWGTRPEQRPQSWEVLEWIEILMSDPMNIGRGDKNYIYPSFTNSFTSREQSSSVQMSVFDSNLMNKVLMEEDRQSTYASTQFETVQCGMLTKLESQDNIIPLAGKKSSNLTDTAPNCSLLPVCYNSSPTNLRCCKDRSFFDNRVEFQIERDSLQLPDFLEVLDSQGLESSDSVGNTLDLYY